MGGTKRRLICANSVGRKMLLPLRLCAERHGEAWWVMRGLTPARVDETGADSYRAPVPSLFRFLGPLLGPLLC
jgi:hypothetical protein